MNAEHVSSLICMMQNVKKILNAEMLLVYSQYRPSAVHGISSLFIYWFVFTWIKMNDIILQKI